MKLSVEMDLGKPEGTRLGEVSAPPKGLYNTWGGKVSYTDQSNY